MEKIDVLMADIVALKNTVAALLPLIPQRDLLIQRMDAGALAVEAHLLSNPVTEDYLVAVQRKLKEQRDLVAS